MPPKKGKVAKVGIQETPRITANDMLSHAMGDVARLREVLAERDEEISSLKKQNSTMTRELNDLRKDFAFLGAEIHNYLKDAASSADKNDPMDDMNFLSNRVAHLTGKHNLEKQLANFMKQNPERVAVAELREQIDNLQKALALAYEIEPTSDTLKSAKKQALKAQNKLLEANEKLEDANKKIETLQKRVQALEPQRKQALAKDSNTETSELTVDDCEKRLERRDKKIEELENEVMKLRRDVQLHEDSWERIAKDIEDDDLITKQLHELASKSKNLERELNKRIDEFDSARRRMEGEINRLQRECTQCHQTKLDADGHIARQKKENKALRENVKNFEKRLNMVLGSGENVEDGRDRELEISVLNQERDGLKTEVNRLRTELADARIQLTICEETITRYTEENRKLRTESKRNETLSAREKEVMARSSKNITFAKQALNLREEKIVEREKDIDDRLAKLQQEMENLKALDRELRKRKEEVEAWECEVNKGCPFCKGDPRISIYRSADVNHDVCKKQLQAKEEELKKALGSEYRKFEALEASHHTVIEEKNQKIESLTKECRSLHDRLMNQEEKDDALETMRRQLREAETKRDETIRENNDLLVRSSQIDEILAKYGKNYENKLKELESQQKQKGDDTSRLQRPRKRIIEELEDSTSSNTEERPRKRAYKHDNSSRSQAVRNLANLAPTVNVSVSRNRILGYAFYRKHLGEPDHLHAVVTAGEDYVPQQLSEDTGISIDNLFDPDSEPQLLRNLDALLFPKSEGILPHRIQRDQTFLRGGSWPDDDKGTESSESGRNRDYRWTDEARLKPAGYDSDIKMEGLTVIDGAMDSSHLNSRSLWLRGGALWDYFRRSRSERGLPIVVEQEQNAACADEIRSERLESSEDEISLYDTQPQDSRADTADETQVRDDLNLSQGDKGNAKALPMENSFGSEVVKKPSKPKKFKRRYTPMILPSNTRVNKHVHNYLGLTANIAYSGQLHVYQRHSYNNHCNLCWEKIDELNRDEAAQHLERCPHFNYEIFGVYPWEDDGVERETQDEEQTEESPPREEGLEEFGDFLYPNEPHTRGIVEEEVPDLLMKPTPDDLAKQGYLKKVQVSEALFLRRRHKRLVRQEGVNYTKLVNGLKVETTLQDAYNEKRRCCGRCGTDFFSTTLANKEECDNHLYNCNVRPGDFVSAAQGKNIKKARDEGTWDPPVRRTIIYRRIDSSITTGSSMSKEASECVSNDVEKDDVNKTVLENEGEIEVTTRNAVKKQRLWKPIPLADGKIPNSAKGKRSPKGSEKDSGDAGRILGYQKGKPSSTKSSGKLKIILHKTEEERYDVRQHPTDPDVDVVIGRLDPSYIPSKPPKQKAVPKPKPMTKKTFAEQFIEEARPGFRPTLLPDEVIMRDHDELSRFHDLKDLNKRHRKLFDPVKERREQEKYNIAFDSEWKRLHPDRDPDECQSLEAVINEIEAERWGQDGSPNSRSSSDEPDTISNSNVGSFLHQSVAPDNAVPRNIAPSELNPGNTEVSICSPRAPVPPPGSRWMQHRNAKSADSDSSSSSNESFPTLSQISGHLNESALFEERSMFKIAPTTTQPSTQYPRLPVPLGEGSSIGRIASPWELAGGEVNVNAVGAVAPKASTKDGEPVPHPGVSFLEQLSKELTEKDDANRRNAENSAVQTLFGVDRSQDALEECIGKEIISKLQNVLHDSASESTAREPKAGDNNCSQSPEGFTRANMIRILEREGYSVQKRDTGNVSRGLEEPSLEEMRRILEEKGYFVTEKPDSSKSSVQAPRDFTTEEAMEKLIEGGYRVLKQGERTLTTIPSPEEPTSTVKQLHKLRGEDADTQTRNTDANHTCTQTDSTLHRDVCSFCGGRIGFRTRNKRLRSEHGDDANTIDGVYKYRRVDSPPFRPSRMELEVDGYRLPVPLISTLPKQYRTEVERTRK